jgi:hypothetical protein
MTRTIDAIHRADNPENVGRALIEPLYRLFDERNSAAPATTEPDDGNASALAPLAAIGLVALLMLWAVINPML